MAITKSRRDLQEHVTRFDAIEGREFLVDDGPGARDDHHHATQRGHRESFPEDTRR